MRKFLNITNKSLSELSAISYQELWTKAQAEGYEGLSVCVVSEFTKAADGNKFHAVFSSDSEDRHGDVVHQEFDLRAFRKNPVFLDSHNYGSIERIIGKVAKISVKEDKLQGDIEFAVDNPLGALAMKLAEGGFLNTTSIGFIPREFNDKGEMLKSELLEVSAVSVPANADALFDKKQVEPPIVDPNTEPPTPAPEEVQPAQAPEPQPVPKVIDRKAVAARVVSQMAEDQKSLVRGIARAVHELTEENKQAQRRKIFKAVRTLLNE